MKITLDKNEIKSLMEKYYEIKNEIVEVELGASISYEGFYEDKTAKTKIIVKKKINIMGMEKSIEDELSKDEVLGIFNEMLKDDGLNVKSVRYNAGINQGGSYIWESNGCSAYFSGMDLEVEKVNNVQRKLIV